MWMAIFDRSGSFFGRTSDRGILQRFNEQMDPEYLLDLISFNYALDEIYDWYRRDNGARALAGSINHLRLVGFGEFKATVPLGATWSARAQFNRQETLTSQRSLLRLGFSHDFWQGRARTFVRTTVMAAKPEWDFEIGVGWQASPGEITVAFGVLDPFSDAIYQGLGVSPAISDTALDYKTHPLTVRVGLDLALNRNFRLEAFGLALTPTTVVVESQTSGAGFLQDERYAYAGSLLEWSPSRRTAVGGSATWVRAGLDRQALPAGGPTDNFDLMEKSWQLGLYAIHHLSERLRLQSWLAHTWRSETRLRPVDSPEPSIDFADRILSGNAQVAYQARSGFRSELGFEIVERNIVSEDFLPGATDKDNSRLRIDVGWGFGQRAFFLVGTNLDLDGDGRSVNFDGAHGRFVLNW